MVFYLYHNDQKLIRTHFCDDLLCKKRRRVKGKGFCVFTLELALRRANFRNHKTLEKFDFSFTPSINRALITDFAACRFMDEKRPVSIVGPCGTGTGPLGHCAIRLGHHVLFTTQSKMLGKLHAARASNSYDRQFNNLTKVGLLIIDDFGLKPLRPPQDARSTIVTSNLHLSEWGDAFPNRLLGAATIDRLRHGAYKVVLEGKSYRSPIPLPKPQKTAPERTPKETLAKGGQKG